MSRRWLPVLFAIIALGVTGISATAKTDSSNTISATIDLFSTTTVGTTKLAPGKYKVTADASKATFEQGDKVVAEVPCTLKDVSGKIKETNFITDSGRLTEIQISGKTKTIDFSTGQ